MAPYIISYWADGDISWYYIDCIFGRGLDDPDSDHWDKYFDGKYPYYEFNIAAWIK